MAKMSFYCDCGAAYTITGGKGVLAHTQMGVLLGRAKHEHINRLGHKETDARKCAAARRKAERLLA